MRIVPETIYRSVYDRNCVLTVKRREALRTGRVRRKRQRRGDERRGRFTTAKRIHERPLEAQQRKVPGHWEGDLVRHEALLDRGG